MAEKQKKAVFGSLQPDVDPLLELNDLTAADFAPATSGEKEDFIQQRKSVSYWADAWRRLRKNVVAMVALGVIVLLVLFAFVGPTDTTSSTPAQRTSTPGITPLRPNRPIRRPPPPRTPTRPLPPLKRRRPPAARSSAARTRRSSAPRPRPAAAPSTRV